MKSYKSLTVLAVSLTVFVGYNFMSAAWTVPVGPPPSGNTEAPVNVGPTDQSKSGALGASEFQSNRYCTATGEFCFSPRDVVVDEPMSTSTFLNTSSVAQRKAGILTLGGLLVEGAGTIASAGPKIKFDDTDSGAIDFWAHANSNSFYILTDRNSDAVFDAPNPLRLFTGATPADDYAAFPNNVRAKKYCDENGQNCKSITELTNSCAIDILKVNTPNDCNPSPNCPAGYESLSNDITGSCSSGSDDYTRTCLGVICS